MHGKARANARVPKDKAKLAINWNDLMDFVKVAKSIKDYTASSGRVATQKTIAHSMGRSAETMSAHLRAIELQFGQGRHFDSEKGEWVGGRRALFLRSEKDQLQMALTTEGERLAAVFSLISDIMRFHENTADVGEVDPFLEAVAEVRGVAIRKLASIPRHTSPDVDEYFTSGDLKSLGLSKIKFRAKPAHEAIEEEAEAYRVTRKPPAARS